MKFNFFSSPHRRYNPLKDEWVLVSPQRTKRPWQGKQEISVLAKKPEYDPKCYMCPGNARASGDNNPRYQNTFVFENDFPALIQSESSEENKNSILFRIEKVTGFCKVISFSPRHDLTLAQMNTDQIEKVISTWIEQSNKLGRKYSWVQIFENKGEIMGCSNPHPHGQIWASNFIPNEIVKEDIQQNKYFKDFNSVLLIDYTQEEMRKKERVITENDSWLVVVPFWAFWPYETLLLPKKHKSQIIKLSNVDIKLLAQIMKKLLTAYDRLFDTSMPYSMGWHFAPFNQNNNTYWQLHAHYYPPLLRSATVKKFVVGYEMLSELQRDITPELCAQQLRKLV